MQIKFISFQWYSTAWASIFSRASLSLILRIIIWPLSRDKTLLGTRGKIWTGLQSVDCRKTFTPCSFCFMYRGSHWAATASSTPTSDAVYEKTGFHCWWSRGWEGESNIVVLHPSPGWYRPGSWSGMYQCQKYSIDVTKSIPVKNRLIGEWFYR